MVTRLRKTKTKRKKKSKQNQNKTLWLRGKVRKGERER